MSPLCVERVSNAVPHAHFTLIVSYFGWSLALRSGPVSFFFGSTDSTAFAMMNLFSLEVCLPAGSRFACNGRAHRHIDLPVAPPTESRLSKPMDTMALGASHPLSSV
jgi:hypothetical protein